MVGFPNPDEAKYANHFFSDKITLLPGSSLVTIKESAS